MEKSGSDPSPKTRVEDGLEAGFGDARAGSPAKIPRAAIALDCVVPVCRAAHRRLARNGLGRFAVARVRGPLRMLFAKAGIVVRIFYISAVYAKTCSRAGGGTRDIGAGSSRSGWRRSCDSSALRGDMNWSRRRIDTQQRRGECTVDAKTPARCSNRVGSGSNCDRDTARIDGEGRETRA